MPEIDFNINDHVRVKLTQHGLDILRAQHEELRKRFPKIREFKTPQTDSEGYTKFQMHALFQHFGEHVHCGCDLPFETNIKISVK